MIILNGFNHRVYPERKCIPGLIYLVKCHEYYKIGQTGGHINARISQIQTGNPYAVELIDQFSSYKPRKDEDFLHRLFDNVRVRGEWFEIPSIYIESREIWFKPFENMSVKQIQDEIESKILAGK
jgi:hypothetical protein